jgi:hypothetical protein
MRVLCNEPMKSNDRDGAFCRLAKAFKNIKPAKHCGAARVPALAMRPGV